MSWKAEVSTDHTGAFYGNALRFATQEEAEAYARDLTGRWTAVRDSRVVASTDPVSYSWVDGKLTAVTVQS